MILLATAPWEPNSDGDEAEEEEEEEEEEDGANQYQNAAADSRFRCRFFSPKRETQFVPFSPKSARFPLPSLPSLARVYINNVRADRIVCVRVMISVVPNSESLAPTFESLSALIMIFDVTSQIFLRDPKRQKCKEIRNP